MVEMKRKADFHNVLKGYNMLLYFAGSMLMYEPTEECVVDFWKNGIIKQLPVRSMNQRFIKAASQLRESCEDKNICSEKLLNDYSRLFQSNGIPLVKLYESQYTEEENSDTDVKKDNVTEFYNSYGWVSKFRGRIDDDHLGIELLFLTRLIEKYLVLEDEASRTEMRSEIQRFIDRHLLSWIPEMNEQIQRNANTLCYKGIGTLIYACAEDIRNILSNPDKLF
jgi:putative dimethyl sulfoxide reductase chaperone